MVEEFDYVGYLCNLGNNYTIVEGTGLVSSVVKKIMQP